MPRMLFNIVMSAAVLTAGAAMAEPKIAFAPLPDEAALTATDLAAAPPAVVADAPAALSLEEMADISGGDSVQVQVMTQQQLTGVATGNSINAGTVTTGLINFSPDALNGFNGVGNFVLNTGANNTLQGAINISVVTTPNS